MKLKKTLKFFINHSLITSHIFGDFPSYMLINMLKKSLSFFFFLQQFIMTCKKLIRNHLTKTHRMRVINIPYDK